MEESLPFVSSNPNPKAFHEHLKAMDSDSRANAMDARMCYFQSAVEWIKSKDAIVLSFRLCDIARAFR